MESQIRAGQDQGYAALLSEHMSKPGFNSTQPRFNYLKDAVKRQEVPGPGSYQTRFNTQEALGRSSPERHEENAIFKDTTHRDDHNSYLTNQKKKSPVGPNDYFKE